MLVRDICQNNVVVVTGADSVLTAARLMRDQHIGCVIVTADSGDGVRPVGVLTDRDIVVAVLALNLDAEEIAVADVMSADVRVIAADAGIPEALATMRAAGVRRLPVVGAGGVLEGLVSSDDILKALADELGNVARIVVSEQDQERAKRRVKV